MHQLSLSERETVNKVRGSTNLQEIENLKMATKGLIHYFFCYLLIYDEMPLHIVLYLVKIGIVILKMGL